MILEVLITLLKMLCAVYLFLCACCIASVCAKARRALRNGYGLRHDRFFLRIGLCVLFCLVILLIIIWL